MNSINIKNKPLSDSIVENIRNEMRACVTNLRERKLSQSSMDKNIQMKKELILTFCAQEMLKYTTV
jgi:hypothetical protein